MSAIVLEKPCVVVPCYNESLSITSVLEDLKSQSESWFVIVVDNCSTDDTRDLAIRFFEENPEVSGNVICAPKSGKAEAFKEAVNCYRSEIGYLLIDGDHTYSAADLHSLLSLRHEGFHLVNGNRMSSGDYERESRRPFHALGNNLIAFVLRLLFDVSIKDPLSGAKFLSSTFLDRYPGRAQGFQLETDLIVFGQTEGLAMTEVEISYKERPLENPSKLSTFKDGLLILKLILNMSRYYCPLQFFGFFSLVFGLLSLSIGLGVIQEFISDGLVSRVASAVLAATLGLTSLLLLVNGLILDSIRFYHQRR